MKTKKPFKGTVFAVVAIIIFALLAMFVFPSCQKETKNYAVTRTIFLKSVNCPDSLEPSSHTIQFALNYQTEDQMLVDVNKHTFSKWVMPNDTIWLFKGMTDEGFKEDGYLYPDSVYEKSIENACQYVCPK
jgi:hypothetical protein